MLLRRSFVQQGGRTGALRPNWMEQSGMKHAGLLFHAAAHRHTKSRRSYRAAARLSKDLVAFRRRSGERKSNHFLRRHVRRRKYFSGCKCGICAPAAHKLCAQQTAPPLVKKEYFLTVSKSRRSGRSGGFPYFYSVNWRAAAPRGAQAAAATAAAAKTRPPSPRRCPDAAAACRRRTRANSTRR